MEQPQAGQIVRAAGFLLMTQPGQDAKREFLLMRHRDRWDLPKGHCEQGESFLETALRETEEETGIPQANISVDPDFCFQISYPVVYKRSGNQQFDKQVQYFLGFLSEKPSLQLTEHESAEWLSWNPPHQIQSQTIDPLLAAVAQHL